MKKIKGLNVCQMMNHNRFSHCNSPLRVMTARENGDSQSKDKPVFKD